MSKYRTDIDKIRDMANLLLLTDLVPGRVSFVVKHPFTDSYYPALVREDNTVEILDLHKPEHIDIWRQDMKKKFEELSLFEILLHVCKPYRLAFLKFNRNVISNEDLGKCLAMVWHEIENISMDINVKCSELVALFKRADRNTLMNEEERKWFDSLEDEVTVYRGVTDYNKRNEKAMSWTTDYNVAVWFAQRFGQSGEVWKITVPKERVLACFLRREKELVLNLYGKKFDMQRTAVKGGRR